MFGINTTFVKIFECFVPKDRQNEKTAKERCKMGMDDRKKG